MSRHTAVIFLDTQHRSATRDTCVFAMIAISSNTYQTTDWTSMAHKAVPVLLIQRATRVYIISNGFFQELLYTWKSS